MLVTNIIKFLKYFYYYIGWLCNAERGFRNLEFPSGEGRGCKTKPSMGEYRYFLELHIYHWNEMMGYQRDSNLWPAFVMQCSSS